MAKRTYTETKGWVHDAASQQMDELDKQECERSARYAANADDHLW